MLCLISNPGDPLLTFIKDDPVHPEIPVEFRIAKTRFISALVEGTPKAIVCVSLHDFIPESIEDLSKEPEIPTIAIFYTIWSYVPGSAVLLLRATVEEIKRLFPTINRFVTLSPKTDMAKKFHLKNGAIIFRENDSTVNYDYTGTI